MIEVIQAASDLQSICEARAWRFCFIGGLAVQRWGEPRETVDVTHQIFDIDVFSEQPFALEAVYSGSECVTPRRTKERKP